MLELKAGFEISNEVTLSEQINLFLNDKALLDRTAYLAKNYVLNNSGATERIYLDIKKHF